LASGGFSAMDHPMSAPFSGLVTYFDVVIKRWCFASVMLGYVSEGIDAGEFDAGKSLASAKKLCEIKGDVGNFQREAAAAFASGYLGGWLEDRVTSAGSGLFGDTRWSKFGFGFGTSWYDPIPDAGTNLATDAMDSGEIP
ncbi:MAG: hypothetical protein K8T20_10090, partial [Planctomycetes bacterium]|nr:hypothetical protein [Planctomycetota bacterium]